MDSFIIEGGRPLKGEVKIQGSKNAALPILAATLLTNQECILENVPQIEDVHRMMELMQSVGAEAAWLKANTVRVKAADLKPAKINQAAVGRFRASILMIGPLLARSRRLRLVEPGGCQIGARGVATHLLALTALGVKIRIGEERLNGEEGINVTAYDFDARALEPATVVLDEFSVTATENALLLASLLPGETTIKIAAAEPHVQDLCNFLTALGVSIEGIGTHTLKIRGQRRLRGVRHTIIPDVLDAGTFLVAAAATGGAVTLQDVVPEHCESVFKKAAQMGVKLMPDKISGACQDVRVSARLPLRAASLQTLPYPGFPTDLQAPFGLLATQAAGVTLIHDPLYEGRLRYLAELAKMGAHTFIADPHRAIVSGPTPLLGRDIQTFDIRAGATLIIAGLVAKGRTILRNAYQVDRGYERLDERLRALGGVVKRSP